MSRANVLDAKTTSRIASCFCFMPSSKFRVGFEPGMCNLEGERLMTELQLVYGLDVITKPIWHETFGLLDFLILGVRQTFGLLDFLILGVWLSDSGHEFYTRIMHRFPIFFVVVPPAKVLFVRVPHQKNVFLKVHFVYPAFTLPRTINRPYRSRIISSMQLKINK